MRYLKQIWSYLLSLGIVILFIGFLLSFHMEESKPSIAFIICLSVGIPMAFIGAFIGKADDNDKD